MVESWVAEKSNYHGGLYNRQPGDPVIGHYLQIVWRTTTEIGCGMATGSVYDYLMYRYTPPGNRVGESPY
jgi:hypothetical protein